LRWRLSRNTKSVIAALSEQHKKGIAAIQENIKSSSAALSGQHKIEMAAIQENIAAMHEQLNTLVQENELSKSTKSHGSRAKTDTEAARANDDRICSLILKRKKLKDAGISAFDIDEEFPLPGKDDNEDMPSKKKLRRVVKKEEET
jgi:hypothetical protein